MQQWEVAYLYLVRFAHLLPLFLNAFKGLCMQYLQASCYTFGGLT